MLGCFLSFILCFLVLANSQAEQRGTVLRFKNPQGQTESVKLYDASYALLIGVSDYTAGWSDLPNIPDELAQVEQVLKEQGFTVEKHTNVDSTGLKQHFENFIAKHGQGSERANHRLLFFFSGHGHSRGDRGYIVPADAPKPLQNEVGFLSKAVEMQQILTWARRIDAKHALFIFDSCFSGSVFKAKGEENPPHISVFTAKPVRQFISAGGANDRVPASSTFTPMFVDALRYREGDLNKDGYITGWELGYFLSTELPRYLNQHPEFGVINEYRLARGDFVFIVGKNNETTKPQHPAVTTQNTHVTPDYALDKLVQACQRHFNANRLTTGAGGTALECYVQVLEKDPTNSDALLGLENIEIRYGEWINRDLAKGNFTRARRYLKKLELVNPESSILLWAQEELEIIENPDSELSVYVSQLSLIDDLTQWGLANNTEQASQINSAVRNGIYQASIISPVFKFNQGWRKIKKHDLINTKLSNIFIPNKNPEQLLNGIIDNLLIPNGLDMVVLESHFDTGDDINIILMIVVKKIKKAIIHILGFKKSEFMCPNQILINSNKTTLLCKTTYQKISNASAALLDFVRTPDKSLKTDKIFVLHGEVSHSLMASIQPLLQSKISSAVPLGQSHIYVSQLSFIDPLAKTTLGSTEESNLINSAVENGARQALVDIRFIKYNEYGHMLPNTEGNTTKLISLMFDQTKTYKERVNSIINELMIPNGIDVIITGNYIDKGDTVIIKPMTVVRTSKKTVAKTLNFSKADYICTDSASSNKKVLCKNAYKNIATAVKELLDAL